jgi:hypothetical protein
MNIDEVKEMSDVSKVKDQDIIYSYSALQRLKSDLEERISFLEGERKVVLATLGVIEREAEERNIQLKGSRTIDLAERFLARSHQYSRLSIIEATKRILRKAGGYKNTQEIIGSLLSGGYEFTTDSPYRSVYKALTRAVSDDRGIVKKDSLWGLKEWENPDD